MLEQFNNPIVWAALITGAGAVIVNVLGKRLGPVAQAQTVNAMANSLLEQYRADNIALRKEVDEIREELIDCRERRHRHGVHR